MKSALLVMILLNTYSGDNTGLSSQIVPMDNIATCEKVAERINSYEFTNRKIRSKAYKEAFCVENEAEVELVKTKEIKESTVNIIKAEVKVKAEPKTKTVLDNETAKVVVE